MNTNINMIRDWFQTFILYENNFNNSNNIILFIGIHFGYFNEREIIGDLKLSFI